jgi:outer membrane protein OmpA-like peptidoglycan-associated protein
MNKCVLKAFLFAYCIAAPAAAWAAESPTPATNPPDAAKTDAQPAPAAPAPLVVFFDTGSSTIRNEDRAVLDHASRAYNEGKPIVMILTGTADRTGNAEVNLEISQRRAAAVLKGLLARGIPADRFQVLAKGETELPVPTNSGVAELQNRRVEITWR